MQKASDLEFLKFFYNRVMDSVVCDDVAYMIREKFRQTTKKEVPDDYNYELDGDDEEVDVYDPYDYEA